MIITIIVMLILVGVTVSVAINGGLFTTAKKATTQTQKAIDAEQLQTVALGAIDENTGEIDLEKLQEELSNWKVDKDNRQCTSPNGNKFIIDDYGNVEEIIWEQLEDGTITNGEVALQVGDYVNYEKYVTASSVGESEINKLYEELKQYAGIDNYNTTKYSLTKENDLKWRVLDVKDGKIRLISEYPTNSQVYMKGYNGYNNQVYLLDNVCNTLYSTSKGKAQNLKIEDIQNTLDLNKWDYHNFYRSDQGPKRYGETEEYNNYKYYPEIFTKEKTGWINDKQGTEYDLSEQNSPIKQEGTESVESKIKITQTYWYRTMQDTDWKNNVYKNIFIKDSSNSDYKKYWLSSRGIYAHDTYIDFDTRQVREGQVHGDWFIRNNQIREVSGSLRPVVFLSSNAEILSEDQKVNDVWQIQ